VSGELPSRGSILIVDDVITRGTMLLAALSRLHDSFPHATIRAFAMVRTMSGLEVAHPVDMCRGRIEGSSTWGWRRP